MSADNAKAPVGMGHQHRLTCGCNILAGPYAPLEIKWCSTHAAAQELLEALKLLLNRYETICFTGRVARDNETANAAAAAIKKATVRA